MYDHWGTYHRVPQRSLGSFLSPLLLLTAVIYELEWSGGPAYTLPLHSMFMRLCEKYSALRFPLARNRNGRSRRAHVGPPLDSNLMGSSSLRDR